MKIAKSGTLVSILMIFLVLSIASLGTFAYFNDVETVGQNVITAGTLDLTVNGQNPCTAKITVYDWNPGDTKYFTFNLKNIGSLNGILAIKIQNLVNNENDLEQPEITAGDTGEPGELGDQVKLKIWHDTTKNGVYDSGEYTWPDWPFGSTKILNDIPLDTNLFAAYTMLAGSEHPIIFRLKFITSGVNNNLAMGDSVSFTIEFGLSQAI